MTGLGRATAISLLLGSLAACGGGTETGVTSQADGGSGGGPGGAMGQGGASARGGGGTGAYTASGASGASGGGGGGASGAASVWLLGHEPTTLTEACLEYAAAQLERSDACRGDIELDIDTAIREFDECPDIFFSDGSSFTLEGAIDCIQGWRTLPCEDQRRGVLPSCVPAGSRGEGAPCVYGSQCQSYACSTRRTSCGECLPLAMEGQPCDGATVVCDRGTSCEQGVCTALSGDPVPLKAIGEVCVGSDCPAGAQCKYSADGPSRCMVRPTVGEPCGGADTPLCTNDAYCDESGSCRPRPQAGDPCGRGFNGGLYCAFGYRCLPDEGTDPLTGVCQKVQLPGESCASPDTTCIRGAICTDGVCASADTQAFFVDACGI